MPWRSVFLLLRPHSCRYPEQGSAPFDTGWTLLRCSQRRSHNGPGWTVVDGVRPRWWWRRHAGRARGSGRRSRSRQREKPVPRGAALVDDVLTTGATARAAAAALRGLPTLVLVATCASRVEQGVGPSGGVVAVSPSSGRIDRTTLHARMIDTAGSTRPDGPTRGHVCHGEEHE